MPSHDRASSVCARSGGASCQESFAIPPMSDIATWTTGQVMDYIFYLVWVCGMPIHYRYVATLLYYIEVSSYPYTVCGLYASSHAAARGLSEDRDHTMHIHSGRSCAESNKDAHDAAKTASPVVSLRRLCQQAQRHILARVYARCQEATSLLAHSDLRAVRAITVEEESSSAHKMHGDESATRTSSPSARFFDTDGCSRVLGLRLGNSSMPKLAPLPHATRDTDRTEYGPNSSSDCSSGYSTVCCTVVESVSDCVARQGVEVLCLCGPHELCEEHGSDFSWSAWSKSIYSAALAHTEALELHLCGAMRCCHPSSSNSSGPGHSVWARWLSAKATTRKEECSPSSSSSGLKHDVHNIETNSVLSAYFSKEQYQRKDSLQVMYSRSPTLIPRKLRPKREAVARRSSRDTRKRSREVKHTDAVTVITVSATPIVLSAGTTPAQSLQHCGSTGQSVVNVQSSPYHSKQDAHSLLSSLSSPSTSSCGVCDASNNVSEDEVELIEGSVSSSQMSMHQCRDVTWTSSVRMKGVVASQRQQQQQQQEEEYAKKPCSSITSVVVISSSDEDSEEKE